MTPAYNCKYQNGIFYVIEIKKYSYLKAITKSQRAIPNIQNSYTSTPIHLDLIGSSSFSILSRSSEIFWSSSSIITSPVSKSVRWPSNHFSTVTRPLSTIRIISYTYEAFWQTFTIQWVCLSSRELSHLRNELLLFELWVLKDVAQIAVAHVSNKTILRDNKQIL